MPHACHQQHAAHVHCHMGNTMCLHLADVRKLESAGLISSNCRFVDSAEWWVNGDNWESSVLFFVMFYQYITCALAYSFGSTFRLSFLYNWAVVVSFLPCPCPALALPLPCPCPALPLFLLCQPTHIYLHFLTSCTRVSCMKVKSLP